MKNNTNAQRKATLIFKKLVKITVITFLCLVLLFAVYLGLIYIKDSRAIKNMNAGQVTSGDAASTTQSTTATSYIDVPVKDERVLVSERSSDIPVTLSDEGYETVLEKINGSDYSFKTAEYYAQDEVLELYKSTAVNKSTDTTLLTDGRLDADKLFQNVLKNNEAAVVNGKNTINGFYSEVSDSDIEKICREIARFINDRPVDFDIEKLANTLERLTVFQHSGDVSNAAITTKMTFIYNSSMIDLYTMQQDARDTNDPETVWSQVIDHEIMHLIQHENNDGNNENGVEFGICRLYNDPNEENTVPVDSLDFRWILEAGAEIGMCDYLGVNAGTYQKKISYAKSFNLSRFYEIDGREDMLEKIAMKDTIEDAFELLGLETEQEQREFLEFMYSIEITQTDPPELWDYYEAKTGKTLTDDEKLGIRMDIRTEGVKYMTRSFFRNLADAVHDGAIADLDSVFYMLRLWELDCFGHLNYTEKASLEHAEDFVLWYAQLQDSFLREIAQSSSLDSDEMQTRYSAYSMRLLGEEDNTTDNCDLTGINEYMRSYILSSKDNYATSKFSRIEDVAGYLQK